MRIASHTLILAIRLALPAFACTCAAPLFAQEEEAPAEQLENFFRDNEQAAEADAQILLEILEQRRYRPFDLNKVSRDDLISLRLLNDLQIENLIAYREKLGPFLNDFELQAVPGLHVQDIKALLLYANVGGSTDARSAPITQGFLQGDNQLLFRMGRQTPPSYRVGSELGAPYAMAFRYLHNFDNRLRFGITGENDAGEPFFSGVNRAGFDFYSAHLFAQNINRFWKAISLGDYSMRLGQGLMLQTGFAAGKSAETIMISRSGRKLTPYAAFGEVFFLRGAAVSIAPAPNWEVTLFYSDRRRDAGIVAAQDTFSGDDEERRFTALQTSGLHRTATEIKNKNAVRERMAGASITREWAIGQISVNGLYTEYDVEWQPAEAAYRQFSFRGNQLLNGSIDYRFARRNWYLSGETALSDNGSRATVNGLLFSPERRVTLSILHRDFSPRYQAIYAAPFAEGSTPNNERGLYLGIDARFRRRWQINAYADMWRHPWLRFQVSGPSQGREYLTRITYTPNKVFSAYVLWFSENKERNRTLEDGVNRLTDNRRGRFRIQANYKVARGLEMRSRLEWTSFQFGDQTPSRGFMGFQEVIYKALSLPVSGSLRYGIFDTDDFDTRVFAFENDLFSAVSIPAFAGRGARYYLNLQYRINRAWRIEGRFEQTNLIRGVTSGSFEGRRTFWKLQTRVRF